MAFGWTRKFKSSAAVAMLPAILIVLWHFAFIVFGVTTLTDDQAIRGVQCGAQTHTWKYAGLNVVVAFFSLVTFFLFPGGGEGARARAVLLTILHFAFAAWGVLMWSRTTTTCLQLIWDKYSTMYIFDHVCVAHNLFFSVLLCIHEMFLGKQIGADQTLIFEIRVRQGAYPMQGSDESGIKEPPPSLPQLHQSAPGHMHASNFSSEYKELAAGGAQEGEVRSQQDDTPRFGLNKREDLDSTVNPHDP